VFPDYRLFHIPLSGNHHVLHPSPSASVYPLSGSRKHIYQQAKTLFRRGKAGILLNEMSTKASSGSSIRQFKAGANYSLIREITKRL